MRCQSVAKPFTAEYWCIGATTTRFFNVTSRIEIGSNSNGPAMYNLQMSAVSHDRYEDAYLRRILRETKTIAMVGASANWNRPSYFAMKYLKDRGYKIYPVNPGAVGQKILGEEVYGSLADLPQKVDMVDIFRNSEAAGPITDEAIKHGAKVVWMQLGVVNDDAARRAETAGLKVVMNRCPKIEHSRLSGSIEWHGIASGVITSKKRAL
jgi:predicted CoA-binding protein